MGQLTQTTAELQSAVDLELSKAAGTGIKVDTAAPTFPWVDLIGLVLPNTANPAESPSIAEFQTGVNAYAYAVGDKLNCVFHIPHDYVPGSDMFIHIHWGHNGTSITGTGTLTATAVCTYGDRDGVFGSPVTASMSDAAVTTATHPQYAHLVTETQLTATTPSGTQLDSDDIEIDGVIVATFELTVKPTIVGGSADPFIFTADLHYQSTGIGTKQNASPFYT